LATDGTLRIVPVEPPRITSVVFSGGNVLMGGTNGPANGVYYLLAATNVATPIGNWTRVATNNFGADGMFSITNPVNPALPREFYLLQLP
jgi:hypothetical protein